MDFYRLLRIPVFALYALFFYGNVYGTDSVDINGNNEVKISLGKSKAVFKADDIIKIKLCDKYYKSEFFVQNDKRADVYRNNGLVIYKQEIEDKKRNIFINFTVNFELQEREIKVTSQVDIDSEDYIIKEVSMPALEFYYPDESVYACYYPSGMGKRVEDLENLSKVGFSYPGDNGTMQWYTMNSAKNGIYIGTHDDSQQPKTFEIYRREKGRIVSELKMPVHSDKFQSPAMIVRLYEGSWHEAARFYRTWYDTRFRVVDSPDWNRRGLC